MNTRSSRTNAGLLTAAVVSAALFLIATQFRLPPGRSEVETPEGMVVIAAPIQTLMYAGDRFLAANLEVMRLAAIGPSEEEPLTDYRRRAHELVVQLNPCHEDNVYLSNAMLNWGGLVDEGNAILERATECRYWDYVPPFFLGFNRFFFLRDVDGARAAIDLAADRNVEYRPSLQQISILMATKKLNDVKMAAAYLRNERDQATDPRLAEMLNRRLQRLEGLITLRDAHARYEKEKGRPLKDPNELIASGILDAFPQDPTRLGYEFVDGRFQLRPLKIGGREIR